MSPSGRARSLLRTSARILLMERVSPSTSLWQPHRSGWRLAKEVLHWQPVGQRRLARPTHLWDNQVKWYDFYQDLIIRKKNGMNMNCGSQWACSVCVHSRPRGLQAWLADARPDRQTAGRTDGLTGSLIDVSDRLWNIFQFTSGLNSQGCEDPIISGLCCR